MSYSPWQRCITRTAMTLTLLGGLLSTGAIPTLQPRTTSTTSPAQLAAFPILTWQSNAAQANTSGGRARGGSFDSEPEDSYSDDGYSSSYDARRDGRNNNNYNDSQEPMGFFGFLILLVVLGMMYRSGAFAEILKSSNLATSPAADDAPAKSNIQTVASPSGATTTTYQLRSPQPVQSVQPRHRSTYSSGRSSGRSSGTRNRTAAKRFSRELTNDTVTITQLQVGMLASARHVQQALNSIATDTDMSTKKGLTKSLRETVVALLRAPETWSHVSAKSQKLRSRQAAKESFESLSLEERSRFAAETLSNEQGSVRVETGAAPADELAAYIVVTLIIGSAHDKSVIGDVRSIEELRAALKAIGSITPDYLMVYEVLWSPQDETDSLTDDEMLFNYPHMMSIA